VKTNVSCRASDALNRRTNAIEKFIFAYGLSTDKLLETIWEVVPYSFVVDWVVNMNGLLSLPRFEDSLRTLSNGAFVSHLGYSVKIEIPFTAQMMYPHASTQNSWYWRSILPLEQTIGITAPTNAAGVVSLYQRNVGFPPSGVSLFANRGLSVSQGVSGFSLLLQRILRR
jgi:hypothetical protein